MDTELIITIRYQPEERGDVDPHDEFSSIDDANLLQAAFLSDLKTNDNSIINTANAWNLFALEGPDTITWEVKNK